MAEYIDREQLVNELEALIKFMKELYGKKARVASAKKVVELLKCCAPAADVVEVVRCGKCKHFRHNFENDTYCACVAGLIDPEDNDFCSYGVRREEDVVD